MKTLIPIAKARRYAEQIAERLQPFCKRLEIAGSIRREKPFCGDIDLVAEPSDEPALRARIIEGKEVVQNGPQNIHIRLTNGVEVQVFLARSESKDMFDTKPSNWGSLLLLRTGSKEHNIFMAQTARANCCEWKVYEGLFRDGKLIASATEEDIFKALCLKFVPPQKREIEHPADPPSRRPYRLPISPTFKSMSHFLYPCPFCCSSKVSLNSDDLYLWGQCDACLSRGPQVRYNSRDIEERQAEAIRLWNNRRDPNVRN